MSGSSANTTYTELLRHKLVPCSCCGRMTEPNCAFVTTRGFERIAELADVQPLVHGLTEAEVEPGEGKAR